MSAADKPWQMPESDWRATLNRVRAGRALQPSAWPGGARCAVALSFDCDHETYELAVAANQSADLHRVNSAVASGCRVS